MSKIKNKRFGKKWIDNVKRVLNKIWGRCIAEMDIDYLEVEDIQLLQETSKMYKDVLDESEKYVDTMNYQIELLEGIALDISEIKNRLNKLEAKIK